MIQNLLEENNIRVFKRFLDGVVVTKIAKEAGMKYHIAKRMIADYQRVLRMHVGKKMHDKTMEPIDDSWISTNGMRLNKDFWLKELDEFLKSYQNIQKEGLKLTDSVKHLKLTTRTANSVPTGPWFRTDRVDTIADLIELLNKGFQPGKIPGLGKISFQELVEVVESHGFTVNK
jgi:hypothetical protein